MLSKSTGSHVTPSLGEMLINGGNFIQTYLANSQLVFIILILQDQIGIGSTHLKSMPRACTCLNCIVFFVY